MTVNEKGYAKLNYSLDVHARRPDGYHDLTMVMGSVSLWDDVDVTLRRDGRIEAKCSIPWLPRDERNLAVRAARVFFDAAGDKTLGADIRIKKRVPVGAGMAGGSADAAATILALNTLWDLDWPIERLQEVAATLGADMPFCLTGGYARGTGFGERIEQLDDDGDIVRDLTERGFTGHLLVGAYRAELRTPEVYATFDQIGAGDGDENHLQKAAVSLHPRSGQAIEEALRAGASQAFVSGSGPSVIAFVPTEDAADAVQRAWQDSRCVDRIIATNAPARPIVHITA